MKNLLVPLCGRRISRVFVASHAMALCIDQLYFLPVSLFHNGKNNKPDHKDVLMILFNSLSRKLA